ncbi:MAG: phosphatase PAP2 family protein [Nanoarchaeota archaeon]|nr:phosphatase PAP2 family protein [Nanoarchaeota archaeon]
MKPMVVIALCALLAVSFFVDPFVVQLAEAAKNPVLDYIMPWFSHLNTIVLVMVVMTSLFLYEEKKKKFIVPLILSFFLSIFLTLMLKQVFARDRLTDVIYDFQAIGISLKIIDYSFPSTHAAMVFSIIPILEDEFRKIKYFWLFFAIMVCLSRIYLNMHYLSDIIAGVLIGHIIGHFALHHEAKHGLSKRVLHRL